MKKLMTIFGTILMVSLVLNSCKSEEEKKKEKYEEEIKDACDILEYSIDIFNEIEDNKKDDDKVEDLFKELEEAWEYAFKEFDDEMEEVFDDECKRQEKFERLFEDIEEDFEDEAEDFKDFVLDEVNSLIGEEEEYYYEDAAEGEAYDDYYETSVEEATEAAADEWTFAMKAEFMEDCAGNNEYMREYCSCVLDNLEYHYYPSDLEYMDETDIMNFITDNTTCLDLLYGDDTTYE